MSKFLGIGDFICFYCEDTDGYVFSVNSSSVFNNLSIAHKQEKNKPVNIPDPQAIKFQVCIQNRYKLNKKYKKNFTSYDLISHDHERKMQAKNAKAAAEAENVDNLAEQKRNQHKKVRYGDVIQLKHAFTAKYIHVNSTTTSQRDKNNMMLSLLDHNSKSAQFRILPRYKVKSEGEYVQIYDQITFESIKSPGHFFHASLPFQMDVYTFGSELNLGVEQSGLTIVKCHSYFEENEQNVRGGQFVQLFHKELEAYVVAEGLFDDVVTEQVHLRIREINQLNPRTIRPSTSAITYWQIESEKTILSGEKLTWEEQFRFRHATTRMYLCVDEDFNVTLTRDSRDPRTVFKLHPVIQECEEVTFESYARIEHVLSGSWLHALKDQEYKRKQFDDEKDEKSMKALRWDGGELRKVACVHDRRYDDAYTIQKVQPEHVVPYNFIAGVVPFIKNLINDRRAGKGLHAKDSHRLVIALREIKDFMIVSGEPFKARQKLLRNLRVIDILVELLSFPLSGQPDESHFIKIHKECYDILYTYMVGSSRKNSLYFAKHIATFQQYMTEKTELGLKITQMICELIRDNRKIVDRISRHQINDFVNALRTNQNYRYLELLQVLCVCNGVAIADNQTYIAEKWLLEDRRGVYLTERGQNIHEQPNILYISTDGMQSWMALHHFLQKDREEYDDDKVMFLRKQLDLFNALCYGRNEYCIRLITKDLSYLSWEEAFLSLQSEILPDEIRAKYCELIIGLFVDVGNNYSVVDYPQLCFVYEYVGTKDSVKATSSDQYAAKDLVTIFPALRDWIAAFLEKNNCMIASKIHNNMVIQQVLYLLHYLVKFGYYGDVEDVQQLLKPLIQILDGTHDLPFPSDKFGKDSKERKKVIQRFKQYERFEKSPETLAVVNAKYAALEVLDIVLTFEGNARLAGFISKFKDCEKLTKKSQSNLTTTVYEAFDPYDTARSAIRKQKAMVKELREIFDSTSHVNFDELTAILVDLAHYKYDKMNQISLTILNKLYSARMDCFDLALNSLVLVTSDSCCVHREVARQLPLLRMMAKAKWSDEQVQRMQTALRALIEYCHLPKAPDEPHVMNQRILHGHNVIGVVLEILAAETDVQLAEKYSMIEKVLREAVRLLHAIVLQYDEVQTELYNHLDNLLRVKLVESDLALMLKEIFVKNQNLCLKILPHQLLKIVSLAADNQEKAPEFLDLLCAIVKVEGPNLALKRNQTLVMKYIMQNYSKVAYILEQSLEIRERVLLGEMGPAHTQYLISLIDLLATCAEGENRYIESLCQTILAVDDILKILNHPDIATHLKRPFLRYLIFAYMKTTSLKHDNSGASEMLKERDIWSFLESIIEECNYMTDFVSESTNEIIYYMINRPFPKNLRMHENCSLCTMLVSEDENKPLRVNNENAIIKVKQAEFRAHASLHYMFDGVFLFLQIFAEAFYQPDAREKAEEMEIFDTLTRALVDMCTVLAPSMTVPAYLKMMINCLTQIVPKSSHTPAIMEPVVDNIGKGERVVDTIAQMKAGNREYYSSEIEINLKLKTFGKNSKLLYGGHNTVQAQLKTKSNRDYTELNGDDALPLGEQFQNFLKCFINMNSKKTELRYKQASLLINQLAISSSTADFTGSIYGAGASRQRKDQEILDVRCLQLLRAMIHNEERRMPEDWQTRTCEARVKKSVGTIAEIQNTLNSFELCTKILPHLANPSDAIAKEVLSLQSIMLFHANTKVQASLLDYFLYTKEEVFFYAVRNRLQLSTANIKERRLLLNQQKARREEAKERARNLTTTMTLGNKALREIRMYEGKIRLENALNSIKKSEDHLTKQLQKKEPNDPKKKSKGKVKKQVVFSNGNCSENDTKTLLMGSDYEDNLMKGVKVDENAQDDEDLDETDGFDISMKDDGYIELVLKLLARICDGQHTGLQEYLREQPDNIKSFNLVGEVVQFLNVVYSNINPDTITLVTQVFSTINEFVSGNQDNRVTVYDNKIVDFVNYILRSADFQNCTTEAVVELRQVIVNLVISLIEENSPEATVIAKEVKDTLDKEALYRVMTECYGLHESEYIEEFFSVSSNMKHSKKRGFTKFATNCRNLCRNDIQRELKEALFEVGFSYYVVLSRLYDLDPSMGKKDERQPYRRELVISDNEAKAFKFYKKNASSIEILKENNLQKIHFRVKNKHVLREEVKEKLKWTVDRSSPSNKIRDFMDWSKAILEDIRYQRNILKNPIAVFFTKGWLIWNYTAIILSFFINTIMLVGMKAPSNGSYNIQNYTHDENTLLDPNFYNPNSSPTAEWIEEYSTLPQWVNILGLAHNICCIFILLTYFIADHPSFPNFRKYFHLMRSKLCPKTHADVEEAYEDDSSGSSKMTASFFSVKTLYYLLYLGMSLAGHWYSPYFFAFHMLNVVHNNQLLQGVISAVTQNGKSLIWVGILGIVIIYLYAIVGFAYFRASFVPDKFMYCDTLFHCFVTVLRFGLIGDLFDNMFPHDSNKGSFHNFLYTVAYQLSFFIFITTIGLNIIFGIIVDTFSELRDLKWTAESDMRDTCFICSRNSYDFEHHGQGSEYHVRQEHNMWAYIFYFIHLQDTKINDYTSLDLHVHRLLKEEKYDFFPLNRALCLSAKDEDSTDSKIDELLSNVKELVQRQKEEDTEKKRFEEMLRQRRWQKRYKGHRSHETSLDGDDNCNHLGPNINGNFNRHSPRIFTKQISSDEPMSHIQPSSYPSAMPAISSQPADIISVDSDYDLGAGQDETVQPQDVYHSPDSQTRHQRATDLPPYSGFQSPDYNQGFSAINPGARSSTLDSTVDYPGEEEDPMKFLDDYEKGGSDSGDDRH